MFSKNKILFMSLIFGVLSTKLLGANGSAVAQSANNSLTVKVQASATSSSVSNSPKSGTSIQSVSLSAENAVANSSAAAKTNATMETTLVILKPDCMEKNLWGTVMERFQKAGFELVGNKMMKLSENLLREHYAHLVHLPFFHEVLTFMQSRPVMVLALRKENAIGDMRTLLGPTDSKAAPKGTIRGDYGTDKMQNIAHASDGDVSAQAELKRFFKPDELFSL